MSWLTQMQGKMGCCNNQGSIPNAMLQYAAIYLGTKLQDITPDASTVDCPSNLARIKSALECEMALRDWNEFWEVMAQLAVHEKNNPNPVVEQGYYIFAAGRHSWTGTGTTNSISVTGLLANDLIIATLTARNAGQHLYLAANDHANDQIDITLSGAGSTDVRVDYQVLRAVS